MNKEFTWTDEMVSKLVADAHRDGFHNEPLGIYDRIQNFKQSKIKEKERTEVRDILFVSSPNSKVWHYNVCMNDKIREEKFPLIKQAIEQILNDDEILSGEIFHFNPTPPSGEFITKEKYDEVVQENELLSLKLSDLVNRRYSEMLNDEQLCLPDKVEFEMNRLKRLGIIPQSGELITKEGCETRERDAFNAARIQFSGNPWFLTYEDYVKHGRVSTNNP